MSYTTLYFDLDNTLLDFSAAERSAINNLLVKNGVAAKPEYVSVYSNINKKYWAMFERGEIKREEIFENRFFEFAKTIGANVDVPKMAREYFFFLAEGHDVMPDVHSVLSYVKKKGYTVCVTTNGVSITQHKRIKESGLKSFFDFVFISENTGHQKPEKAYFDYVIQNTPEKNRKNILIIGDSQSSDILGGINAGIDTCWFNPKGVKGEYAATYEIGDIKELCGIL